ncbi:HlyD family efflux transporter periplasmic adaptor subunit [Stenotrophomonas panacihumi]|uniref:HlyD family efflux transporter periplasmic adaptor subunit n=1 Tax=Stenotrophomonas panacihumi TaxID=676599 RepID=UPI000A9CF5C4|nr:HlyD family efflux transporter periplasmic adaptor subunit [Stenotrophomonas panacihumi]
MTSIDAADLPLPPLREDLRLQALPADRMGQPGWVIQDTVVNRFYRVGWLEFEALSRWGGTARELAARIAGHTALRPTVEQITEFTHFLERHQLLRLPVLALEKLRVDSEARRRFNANWLLHHYLFFRIPLAHPQRWLQRTAARLAWLFTPWTVAVILALSVLGLVLVGRQWDEFSTAVVDSFSTEGLLSFAIALCVAKLLHELSHALVATRLGLRVAHMGVAFVVMWPMLYTDTGEAWRLPHARQRLAVASAGILAELALAGVATLAWALSDPGAVRDGFLYLATTGWVLSLALNASPFTRFDGYFILSDLLDFPNLHERAFAQARTALRRGVLGLREPWPEPLPARWRRGLIAFAFVTWIYRFVLFLGIALAVYHFFFKALGIALFVVEVGWFIAMPVMRELGHWWRHRAAIPTRWRRGHLVALGIAALVLLVPWRANVHGYGVARATQQLRVYTPFPARLQQVHAPGRVAAGASLAELDQPDIAARLQGTQANLHALEGQLSALLADPQGIGQQAAMRQRAAVQVDEASAAHAETARLRLVAPFAGVWSDIDPQRRAGQWIGTGEALGVLYDPSHWRVDAYVRQDDVSRMAVGDRVHFYPKGSARRYDGTVTAIAGTRARQLDWPALADRYGGPIATAQQKEGLVPRLPVFHVVVELREAPAQALEAPGEVQVSGERRSLLGSAGRWIAATFLRESGF